MDHTRRSAEALRHLFFSRVRRPRHVDDPAEERGRRRDMDLARRSRAAAPRRRFPARLSDAEESRGDRRLRFGGAAHGRTARRRDRTDSSGHRRRKRPEEDRAAVIIRDILAPNPGPFTLSGTRTYLIDDFAVIDPGPSIESHVEAIRRAMPRLRTIFITHRHGDHAPAALPLREATGARIVAPEGVFEDADRIVRDGDIVEELEVIATPGHTRE